jgi:hypothetical protein
MALKTQNSVDHKIPGTWEMPLVKPIIIGEPTRGFRSPGFNPSRVGWRVNNVGARRAVPEIWYKFKGQIPGVFAIRPSKAHI